MNPKSKEFLQMATIVLAESFVRIAGYSMEDSMALSAEIIPTIDWENESIMHKGMSWIAANYLNRQPA